MGTIVVYSALEDVNASRTIQGVWGVLILLFLSVFLLIDQSRVMGYFSKKPPLQQPRPDQYYSLDRMSHQLEQGKWLYLYQNKVIELPKKFQYFHPGGKAVLEELKGQDIGRYLTGSYRFKGGVIKHKHSPYTLNFIIKHSKGYISENMIIAQNFYGNEGQLPQLAYPLRISFRENLTSLVKRVSFTHPNLQRKLFVADPAYWGKHFKYSAQVPWRVGKLKTVTRYYTFCFSLGQQMRDYTDLLIMKWEKGGEFSQELDIEEETTLTIDAFPKNYNHKKAFSTFLHNLDNQSIDNQFLVQGPMGYGLKLEAGAYGKHIAITAGTGIMPFLDIVLYMLRRNINALGEKEFRRLRIFENEYDQPSIADDFIFELWASFFQMEEVIGLKYIQLLEKISKEHNFNNFKFVLRLSGSDHWDKDFIAQHVDVRVKRIWVRGTQKFNEDIRKSLMRIGFSEGIIDEL